MQLSNGIQTPDAYRLTFDPHLANEIGRQIHRLASEPATLAELRRNAPQRARRYSWSRAAELTLSSLERWESKA